MIRPFTGIPNKYVKTQNDRPQLVAATDVVAASNFVPPKTDISPENNGGWKTVFLVKWPIFK